MPKFSRSWTMHLKNASQDDFTAVLNEIEKQAIAGKKYPAQ